MKYKVEYSDELPEGIGGYCKFPLVPLWGTCKIVIRPKYINDKGLLAHELKHCEQYTKSLFHALKYAVVKSYRYKCELEAYTEQIKAYRYTSLKQCEWIVEALMTKYRLKVERSKVELDIGALLISKG